MCCRRTRPKPFLPCPLHRSCGNCGSVLWRFSAVTLLPYAENPGKQVGAPLPQKTPRKVLGDLKNSSSTQNSARKPPVLGTPKPAFVPARGSTSKQRERGRGGGVSSAHKVAPQRTANELLSELEHMAPPEPGEDRHGCIELARTAHSSRHFV